MVIDIVGLRQGLDDGLRDACAASWSRAIADDDRKLVAAQAAALLVLADAVFKPLRDLSEQAVADLVAKRIC